MSSSLSSSDLSLISTLNSLTPHLNRYLSIIILLFGTVGNILNCIALSQRGLRSNPCASLFLASSVASLITLISGVAVRLLAGWSLDLTDTIGWLCKLRIFILFASRTIASWFIMLATFDRWLSSSKDANRRQKSTLKNARIGMMIVICLTCLAYAQIFYCYEANLTNAPLKCYGKTIWCRLLIDSEFTGISILLPSILMLFFGLKTIATIRTSGRHRIAPVTMTAGSQNQSTKTSHRSRRTDHYLFVMLFVQVVLLTLFSLPQAIQNLYANATRNETKPALTIAINNFVFNLFLLLTYVTNGMPFYIYTLTGGSVFRQALKNALKDCFHRITFRRE